MSGRKRNEARMELQELQMDLKENLADVNEVASATPEKGRRGRRKSAKYEAVAYSKDDEVSDDDGDGAAEKETRRKTMAREMNTIRKEFTLEVILGRRIHPKTGSFEYLCKFEALSHLHMRWLTYEEVELFFPAGHIKRNKVQAYDKKCLQGGYTDTDEVDDLDIGNATVETILSHQAGVSNESLDKKLDDRRLNVPYARKYPRVTDIYLVQHHDAVMERCRGILRRLMAEPSAEPFLHPVNLSDAPGYLDVIYNPIDFGTILGRLKKEVYYSANIIHNICFVLGPIAVALFASDMRLVFANCKEFNAEGSDIVVTADHLAKDFEKMFYEWVICPSAWKLLPSTGDAAEDADILAQFHSEMEASSLRLFGNHTMFLVQWKGLSIRCSTWERAEDIGDDDAIVRYFKTTKVPTDKEIAQTTCQLPCCAKANNGKNQQQRPPSDGIILASRCALDRFCTLGAGHDGMCDRASTALTSSAAAVVVGTPAYTHQKHIEQIRAQLFAFHCLLHHHAPDIRVLKQCGAATVAYAWAKELGQKGASSTKQSKDEDQDYSEGEEESSDEDDDDDDDDDDIMPQVHMPAYSQLFLEPEHHNPPSCSKALTDDSDRSRKLVALPPATQVASVLAAMVEHVALGYEATLVRVPPKVKKPPPVPQVDMTSWSHFHMDTFGPHLRYTEYYVAIQKSVHGLGMRLGLSDDGVARVMGFQRLQNGQVGAAELTGVIAPGDVLVGINNTPTARIVFKQVVEMIGASKDYVLFTFHTTRPAPLFPPACVAKTIERRYLPVQANTDTDADDEPDAAPPSVYIPYSYEAFESSLSVQSRRQKVFTALENYAAPTGPVQHVLAGIMKGTLDPHEHFASFLPVKKTSALSNVVVVSKNPTEFIEDWTDMNVCVYHDVGERGTKFTGKDLRSLIRAQGWYYPNMEQTKSVFKFNVCLTTYETILADFEEFEAIHWRLLAVDEAHRLKSAGSRVLKQMRVLNVDRKLLLTGTPLQNNTQELWVLLNFLEPVIFDNMEDFNDKYGRLHSQEQVMELQRMLTPYLLRRVKEDVEKSIPPKEETIIQVELTTLQKQYYRAIYEKNRSFLYLGTQNGLPTLNNLQLQLRKCCNHPFLIKGAEERELEALGGMPDAETLMQTTIQASGKMVLVSKLLPKLKAEGHKVLIFSQFIRQLDLLERYCEHEGFIYERLDGSSMGSSRQASIDRFSKKNSKSFLFLLSTKAGGVGINLIAADTVIIFDSDWNPQNDLQAQSRCHRIGQKKSVKIYRLVTRNSYESEMFDRASRKLGLEHAVLGTGSFSE
ncbi:hypothetical protein DYB36_008466, partial [Aphanomyces astaci]